MKNETSLLLKLISENKSLNEISSILGLSNKQLFTRLSMLRNGGYQFDKKYTYNGNIYYSFHNPFITKEKVTSIEFPKNTNIIETILISDTHLGHINDTIHYLDSVYNYCTNNGINIILHAGDLFEGIYSERKKLCKFECAEEQISYGLKNYPYDKNILNFILLGNHDATFLTNTGMDIQNILLDRRHDLIPIGYACGNINLNNYRIKIQHPIPNVPLNNDNSNVIILQGHSHTFSTNTGGRTLSIHLPTLSNVTTNGSYNILPSMIKMKLEIKKNTITTENLQQFIFDNNNNPICISNINYHVEIKQSYVNSEDKNIIPNLYENINNDSKKLILKK